MRLKTLMPLFLTLSTGWLPTPGVPQPIAGLSEAGQRTESSTNLPLHGFVAPTSARVGAASSSLSSPSSFESECGEQPDAAAYVCCDGDGGITVCARPGANVVVQACVEEHERDHLGWFARELPDVCRGRPRGACHFQMTPSQFRELECGGYAAEIRCLDRRRPLVSRRDVGVLLKRRRQLAARAGSRFGCFFPGL